jgi:soluble lytic murein transglycosylase-like protein
MRRALALLLVATAGTAFAAHAGTVRADEKATRLPVRPTTAAPAQKHIRCPLPARYRGAFQAAAAETRLPLAILVSMARVESNLRPDALSPAGARGLLQLMPTTATSLALDPTDPAANVLGGARYLREMLDRFGSIDLALAAYNAGPTAVDRAGGAPNGQALTYVANVEEGWHSLNGCT